MQPCNLFGKMQTCRNFLLQIIPDFIVSSTYQIPGTDIVMVYLQQAYKGIPVYNQMKTLAFKGGKIASEAGDFIPSMEKFTAGASPLPAVSPVAAIVAACEEAKVQLKENAVPIFVSEDGKKMTLEG
jgi:hypothetical protein